MLFLFVNLGWFAAVASTGKAAEYKPLDLKVCICKLLRQPEGEGDNSVSFNSGSAEIKEKAGLAGTDYDGLTA